MTKSETSQKGFLITWLMDCWLSMTSQQTAHSAAAPPRDTEAGRGAARSAELAGQGALRVRWRKARAASAADTAELRSGTDLGKRHS